MINQLDLINIYRTLHMTVDYYSIWYHSGGQIRVYRNTIIHVWAIDF